MLDCRPAKPAADKEQVLPSVLLRGRDGQGVEVKLEGARPGEYQRFIITVKGKSVLVKRNDQETQRLTLPANSPEARPPWTKRYRFRPRVHEPLCARVMSSARARKTGCFVSLMAIASIGLAQSPTEILRAGWDAEWAKAAGKVVEQQHYPTEPALVWLSAYSLTRDAKYAEQARRQLDEAHRREKNGLLLIYDGTTTRDYQARQIYNFYVAYRLLAEPKYLRWADACARAMVEVFPRKPKNIGGKSYKLFTAGFLRPEKPGDGTLGYFVDVNQNAEVGLAFGLLYHEPASALFQDATAREIALDETLASMVIQNPETGAVPIGDGDWLDKYDTAYGGYACTSWVWSNLLWRNAEMDKHIRLAGKWLGSRMDLDHDAERWWPKHSTGAMAAWDAYYRIPLYWYCGLEATPFLQSVWARLQRGAEGWAPVHTVAWWDVMGVERSYYLVGPAAPATPPSPSPPPPAKQL